MAAAGKIISELRDNKSFRLDVFCRVVPRMYLARDGCFILYGWIISPENAQNAESHFA
jgi:hypothetical protein